MNRQPLDYNYDDLQVETYDPLPSQRRFHASPHKYRLLLGAWGGGKSVAMLWEALQIALAENEGMLCCIFRKTGPALRDTVLEVFDQMCPPELVRRRRDTEGREERELINGSRFWFRPLHKATSRLGSTVFDMICVDESEEIEYKDFRTLRARLRGRRGPRRMILATNPPNVDHWLFDKFVKSPMQDSMVFHLPMFENVAALGQDYIDDQLANLTPSEARKYVYGLWGFVSDGDPVYFDFSENLHISDRLHFDPRLPLIRGWDFGYRHPCVSWGQKLRSGHVNVLGELVRTNMKLEDVIREMREYQLETFGHVPDDQMLDFCDIAGKQERDVGITSIKTLHEHDIFPRRRGMEIMRTVKVIRAALSQFADKRPLFMIHRRCRFTHEAFAGGYIWDPKKDKPLKDEENFYDDIADAVRYWAAPALMLVVRRWGATYKNTDRQSQPYDHHERQRVTV